MRFDIPLLCVIFPLCCAHCEKLLAPGRAPQQCHGTPEYLLKVSLMDCSPGPRGKEVRDVCEPQQSERVGVPAGALLFSRLLCFPWEPSLCVRMVRAY